MRRAISAGEASNGASSLLLAVDFGFRGNVGLAVFHSLSKVGTAPSHSSGATSKMKRSFCPSGSHCFTLPLRSPP